MPRLNWKRDLPDFRDFKYSLHPEQERQITLPALVDLRSKQSPVVNQYAIGSCTGNAIAGALEFLELQELSNQLPPSQAPEEFDPGVFSALSRLFIYYNERVLEGTVDQDSGAQIRDGIKCVRKWGVCRESVWPYLAENALIQPVATAYDEAINHKVLYGYRLDNANLNQLKACLAHGFPFVFGMSVYDSFMSQRVANTGLVPMPSSSDRVEGGHAILCVGYHDEIDHFIVKNSWGSKWGDHGYCYIPYEYLGNSDLCSDLWTLRKDPMILQKSSK